MAEKRIRISKEFDELASEIKNNMENVFGREVSWPEVTKFIAIQNERRIGDIIFSDERGKKRGRILLSLG